MPSSKSSGSTRGAPSAYTDAGPPERIERERIPRARLRRRQPVRHELRVHARLAHAPRDQLRVLAAEVEDEHRPLLGRGLRRSAPAAGTDATYGRR